ncbi:hypothetical protein DRQ33_05995, partial [bacterium]
MAVRMMVCILICASLLFASAVNNPRVDNSTSETTYCWGEGKIFDGYDPSREVISKRDMTSKHFANADGSYTAVIVGGPVHYKNENGEWKEIDTKIIQTPADQDYTYCNETNIFKSYFPTTSNSSSGVKLKFEDSELILWQNARLSWTDSQGAEHNISDINDVNANVSENIVIFDDCFDGIDMEYQVTNTQLRTDIILQQIPEIATTLDENCWLNIAYKMVLPDGATIAGMQKRQNFSTEYGIEIKDTQGNKFIIMPPQLMNNALIPQTGRLRLETVDGELYCYIQIPAKWFIGSNGDENHLMRTTAGSDDEITEPLEILATTVIQPNYAVNWTGWVNNPTYNGGCVDPPSSTCQGYSPDWIYVGPDDFVYCEFRGWVKFDVSSLDGVDITNSTLNLYQCNSNCNGDITVDYYYPGTGTDFEWCCTMGLSTCWANLRSGTQYLNNVNWPDWCGGTGWMGEQDLGATADANIEAAASSPGWYDVTFSSDCAVDNCIAVGGYQGCQEASSTHAPRLTITYTEPCSEPATQASNVSFSNVQSCGMTISWTNGSGTGRAVFMKQTSTGTAAPVDGTSYTANPVFGSGSQIGSTGWYCVYNGTGTSVSVTGLNASTTYRVHVCEYDCDPIDYNANTGTNNPNNQVSSAMTYGTVASGDESICSGGDPSNITLSSMPTGSGSFSYQWYYQDGLPSCPTGGSTSGWTSIPGATASSYDPPSGLTTDRTYAVFITPGGSPTCGSAQWASSCRKVTIEDAPTITSHPSDQTKY